MGSVEPQSTGFDCATHTLECTTAFCCTTQLRMKGLQQHRCNTCKKPPPGPLACSTVGAQTTLFVQTGSSGSFPLLPPCCLHTSTVKSQPPTHQQHGSWRNIRVTQCMCDVLQTKHILTQHQKKQASWHWHQHPHHRRRKRYGANSALLPLAT